MLSAAPVRCPITLDERPLCPQITPCGAHQGVPAWRRLAVWRAACHCCWRLKLLGCTSQGMGEARLADVAQTYVSHPDWATFSPSQLSLGTWICSPLFRFYYSPSVSIIRPTCRPRLLLPRHHRAPRGPRRPRAAQVRALPAVLHAGKHACGWPGWCCAALCCGCAQRCLLCYPQARLVARFPGTGVGVDPCIS